MNRRLCTDRYGTCEEDYCNCHSEEIKAEVEIDLAKAEWETAMENLRKASDRLFASQCQKLEAVARLKPLLDEIINKITK